MNANATNAIAIAIIIIIIWESINLVPARRGKEAKRRWKMAG
jgi:hypothetical protein